MKHEEHQMSSKEHQTSVGEQAENPTNAMEETSRDSVTKENIPEESPTSTVAEGPTSPPAPKKGARFWLLILTLAVTAILAALDMTIVTTTLPTISATLQGGEDYVWVSGTYFLAVSVPPPSHEMSRKDG
jgi:hypothetical protein